MPSAHPPPLLCPYCGHDWGEPGPARCPRCGRAIEALRWTPLPAVQRPLRAMYLTLLACTLLPAVAIAAGTWLGHGRAPGLLPLLLVLSLVLVVLLVREGERPPTEWRFATGDGWAGIVRYASGAIVHASGSALLAREATRCARPPEVCAILRWDAVRGLDAASAAAAVAVVTGVEGGGGDAWVAAYGGLVGLAARERIAFLRKRIELAGWSRDAGGEPRPTEPAHGVVVAVALRDDERAGEGAWEQRGLAVIDGLTTHGQGVGSYRASAALDAVDVVEVVEGVVSMERDAPLPDPSQPPDGERIVAALRAFAAADADLASTLWMSLTEPEAALLPD